MSVKRKFELIENCLEILKENCDWDKMIEEFEKLKTIQEVSETKLPPNPPPHPQPLPRKSPNKVDESLAVPEQECDKKTLCPKILVTEENENGNAQVSEVFNVEQVGVYAYKDS